MTRSNSSCHALNGDRPLSALGKIGYFLLNLANNALPYMRLDPRLEIRDFWCPTLTQRWAAVERLASPSRTLSNLFWMTLPWSAVREELGEIRVLDVGCGRGNYAPRLLAWSGGAIATYVGLDARPSESWAHLEAADSRLRFRQVTASHVLDAIPEGTNLILSQSAVEHFDDDLRFFRLVRNYVLATHGPVLQVHLVP